MAADTDAMIGLHGPGPGPGRDRPSADRAQPVGRLRRRARRRDRRPGRHAAARRRRTPRSRPCARPATGPAAPPSTPRSSPAAHQGRTGRASSRSPRPASPGSSSRSRIPTRRSRARASPSCATLGITVDVGVGADAAARSLAPYLVHRRAGRPFTVVKTAMSLDGRIAAADGSSQWITGAASRADAHRAPRRLAGDRHRRRHRARRPTRASPCATPTAPCTPAAARRCSTPPAASRPTGPLFDAELAPTLVVTTDAGARRRVNGRGSPPGAKVLTVPPAADGAGVDLAATLEVLAGPRRAPGAGRGRRARSRGSLLEAGLADRLVTYVAPTVLGRDGRPALDLAGPATHRRRAALAPGRRRPLGTDVRLDYEPSRRRA